MKKIIAVALALLLILSFAGCKRNKSADDTSSESWIYVDGEGEKVIIDEDGNEVVVKDKKEKESSDDDDETEVIVDSNGSTVTKTKKSSADKSDDTTTSSKTEGTSSKQKNCKHKFIEATCTKPKTCIRCGLTEGSSLGHDAAGEPTCTEAVTCSRCGKIAKDALGHSYKSGKCIRCGVKESDDLKAIYLGDSISYGDATKGVAWAELIDRDHGIKATNVSVSGWTLANTYGGIYTEFDRANSDNYGYVIMHGGFNDANRTENGLIPLGTITPAGTTSFDVTTTAGGMEKLFYEAQQRFPKAKKGFIINYIVNSASQSTNARFNDFVILAKQICDKWGVKYLDLSSNAAVNSNINTKLADGLHPNAAGYEYLTPIIYDWMMTL